jgi:hypothetical protein
MTVTNELIDSLLADYKKPEDLIGENGLPKGLLRMVKLALIDANMNKVVRNRFKVLSHWHNFGLASTVHAFDIDKSTL